MTPKEFDACFDGFRESAWRLENLQQYTLDTEEERIRAWREGRPRPERSVRTSPWLRRVAVSTAAGKRWGRVHVVERPLSEYLRYQMGGYIETAAAGEEIRIADRAGHSGLADLGPDFWLLDGDSPEAHAIVMSYDKDGHWLGAELTRDPGTLEKCRRDLDLAIRYSVALNTFLASIGADALRQVA